MNGETIFKALSGVGDDLIEKAETKKFSNPWKKWAQAAAVIALVLCLGTVILPYFPMGCGSAQAPPTAEDAPMEEEAAAEEETAAEEERPMPEPEASADESANQEMPWQAEFRWEGQTYTVLPEQLAEPEQLGALLGTVHTWEGLDLGEAELYEGPEQRIYVKTKDAWYRAEMSVASP